MCANSSFGTCVPGRYIAVGLSSGVAVKRGSTVLKSLISVCQYSLQSEGSQQFVSLVVLGFYAGTVSGNENCF